MKKVMIAAICMLMFNCMMYSARVMKALFH